MAYTDSDTGASWAVHNTRLMCSFIFKKALNYDYCARGYCQEGNVMACSAYDWLGYVTKAKACQRQSRVGLSPKTSQDNTGLVIVFVKYYTILFHTFKFNKYYFK